MWQIAIFSCAAILSGTKQLMIVYAHILTQTHTNILPKKRILLATSIFTADKLCRTACICSKIALKIIIGYIEAHTPPAVVSNAAVAVALQFFKPPVSSFSIYVALHTIFFVVVACLVFSLAFPFLAGSSIFDLCFFVFPLLINFIFMSK